PTIPHPGLRSRIGGPGGQEDAGGSTRSVQATASPLSIASSDDCGAPAYLRRSSSSTRRWTGSPAGASVARTDAPGRLTAGAAGPDVAVPPRARAVRRAQVGHAVDHHRPDRGGRRGTVGAGGDDCDHLGPVEQVHDVVEAHAWTNRRGGTGIPGRPPRGGGGD